MEISNPHWSWEIDKSENVAKEVVQSFRISRKVDVGEQEGSALLLEVVEVDLLPWVVLVAELIIPIYNILLTNKKGTEIEKILSN